MQSRRRRGYGLVVVVTAALIAGACSSRGSDSGAGSTTTNRSSTSTTPDAKSPCGPGTAKGATAPGVTDTEISFAMIADIKVAGIGNLFQGNLDATNAFVAYCNSLGGINGRQLKMTFIDAKLLSFPDAVRQACEGNYLAMVGSAAALDGGVGPSIGGGRGLVDVPAFTADAAHRTAKNMVVPIPNPVTTVVIGAELMMKAKFPDSVKKTAFVYSNRAVTQNTATQRTEAMKANGWTFSNPAGYVTGDIPTVQEYQAIVTDMQSKGVTWVSFVGAPSAQSNFRKALDIVGWHPTVSDSDTSAYDSELVAAAGPAADGINFPSNIFPLELASENPETQLFLDWLAETDAVTTPTSLGVQSFSAGLLFATVVKSLGSNVTRTALLSGLKAVHKWTGEGLHAEANPGANTAPDCTAWMKIKNGKFVRVQPAPRAKQAWQCDPDYVVPVKVPTA